MKLGSDLAICIIALGVLVAGGCATTVERRNLAELETVHEMGVPEPRPLTFADGVLSNLDPALDPSSKEAQKPGPGIGLLPVFSAQDVDLEAEMEFSETGAPALVFRVQTEGPAVTAMYSLALHRRGVNLWRLNDAGWTLVETHVFPVEPDTKHLLHARAVADKIAVDYDGKPLFVAQDTFLMLPGRAGVRGSEGPCRFYALRATNLD